MSSATKADKKAAVDAAACMFNVVTSVGIIIVNKALMAMYGFSFATTLIGMHFGTTTILTVFLRWMGYIQTSHLPSSELLRFVLFANFSIVGMWSSVGFYKLSWTRCGFEDVSVNTQGFIAAFIVVWSTAMQQYYVHYLQRKYALGSFNLLGHTAPAQAASLLLLGPFLDYWLTSKRVDAYNYGFASVEGNDVAYVCLLEFAWAVLFLRGIVDF
ncbi:hypothetical protein EZV62_015040 [Acer yangbiense]|uniref:Sugar phosphate transporter domain-containing protein n=1 Tax=Acer yangbiense TaxID=1000413 RepID=A0A5C7HTM2_9ROSI|nr:hypothetical protein EZV62_015040 [Acer yangbiense]